MTTLSEAREAILSRFNTLWTGDEPVVFDNEEYDSKDQTPWLRLVIRHTDSGPETLGPVGGRKFFREAIVLIDIFTAKDIGTSVADILSTTAKNIFEGESFSGLDFNRAHIQEIGNDDRWYQQQMEANFNYHETK